MTLRLSKHNSTGRRYNFAESSRQNAKYLLVLFQIFGKKLLIFVLKCCPVQSMKCNLRNTADFDGKEQRTHLLVERSERLNCYPVGRLIILRPGVFSNVTATFQDNGKGFRNFVFGLGYAFREKAT